MKLSEVPYDQVHLGFRVIGHNGVHGTIVDKMHYDCRDYGSDGLLIVWDNGNQSKITILECFNVEVRE